MARGANSLRDPLRYLLLDSVTVRTVFMKAKILWHAAATGATSGEVHRFGFALEDVNGAPCYTGVITLRTAKVLVAELAGSDGFMNMLRAIVETLPGDYDSLIGQHFHDGAGPQRLVDPSNPSA